MSAVDVSVTITDIPRQREIWRIVAVVVLYMLFTWKGFDERNRFQRRVLKGLRDGFAEHFGLKKLAALDENAYETGPAWRVLAMFYNLLMLLTALAYLFEGQARMAMNIFLMAVFYSFIMMKIPRSWNLWISRIAYVHQISSIYFWQFEMDSTVMNRAVITRSLASIMLFEMMDETMFHMLSMSVVYAEKLGWHADLTFLPVRMYFMVLLPMHLLGLREWILTKSWFDDKQKEDKREFTLAVSIPLMTILFTFSSGIEMPKDGSHIIFLRVFSAFNVCLFSICWAFGDALDELVMGNTFVRSSQIVKSSLATFPDLPGSNDEGDNRSNWRENEKISSLMVYMNDLFTSKSDFFNKDDGTSGGKSLAGMTPKEEEREEDDEHTDSNASLSDGYDEELESVAAANEERNHNPDESTANEKRNEGEDTATQSSSSSSSYKPIRYRLSRILRKYIRIPMHVSQQLHAGPFSEDDLTRFSTRPLKLMDVIFILTAATMAVFVSSVSILPMAALFAMGRHPSTRILRFRWRSVVFLAHTAMLCYVLYRRSWFNDNPTRCWKERPALVALLTVRMLFAFEKRRFSFVERESAMVSTLISFSIQDHELVSLTVFLLVSTYIIALIVSFSRDHMAGMLRREDDSHAFLFHALKQKFSGVGSATEHILEHRYFRSTSDSLPASSAIAVTNATAATTMTQANQWMPSFKQPDSPVSSPLKSLLVSILHECRKGQDSCHAVNVLRNIKQHRYRSQKSFNALRDVLDQWRMSGHLNLKNLHFTGNLRPSDAYVELELNWELFRLLLSEWTRGATGLKIEVLFRDLPKSTDDLGSDDTRAPLHVKELRTATFTTKGPRFNSDLCTETQDCEPFIISDLPSSHTPTTEAPPPERATVHLSFSPPLQPQRPMFVTTCELKLQVYGKPALSPDRRAQLLPMAEELVGSFQTLNGGEDVLVLRGMKARIEVEGTGESGSSKQPSVSSGGAATMDTPLSMRRMVEEASLSSEGLPENLRYAILDDNSLVRKNIHRIVLNHLHGEDNSFARGSSPEECLTFAQEIIDRNVDIAILDENLDFEPDRLSGTDIARIARQKGFPGCLLLHSAQAGIAYDPCFDGFVEKTASRRDFAHGIFKGWQSHVRQSRRAQRQNSGSSLPSLEGNAT